jgi:hypothetical protein
MLIYNVISQIEDGWNNKQSSLKQKPPPPVYGEPKKTFELFDMMKKISQKFCPAEFVKPDWLELAIDLFYILHKGNVFRYEEPISQEQYDWIKDILTKCDASIQSIPLSAEGSSKANSTCGISSGGKVSC